MEFTIKNFGPISEAVIDLSKDLIIITGENNSGKTFAANLIYSLFNQEYTNVDTELPKLNRSHPPNGRDTVDEDTLIVEVSITEYFELNADKFKEQILETLKKNVAKDFSIGEHQIEEAMFILKVSDYFRNLTNKLWLSSKHFEGNIVDGEEPIYVRKKGNSIVVFDIELVFKNLDFLEDYMRSVLSDISFQILFNNTFIIPAERQGINLFTRDLTLYKTKIYDILTQLNIDKSTKLLGKLQENVGRYSKPVTDHIDFIAGLSSTNGHKTAFYDLVIDFEKEAIDGHIAVSEQGEIKFMTEGLELGTNSMSSTVKSLSSLMYYLKYKAKKGDFILIDEPELNLHQDNQVKLAKFLAKLTNMGIKILISTHSDYMIRVFNDLIMLNHIQTRDKSQASELAKYNGYQADEVLDHKNMAVYLFRKKKKVSAVHIDETGFEISTIDEVIDHINRTSNEIYAEL